MADMEYTALARKVREDLELMKVNLEMAHAGILTASAALKYQAANLDPDVADVLERFVGNCVYQQIRRAEAFLDFLSPEAADLRKSGYGKFDESEAFQ